jgi:hypothetical protein
MYAVPMNDKIKQKTTTILALIIATIARSKPKTHIFYIEIIKRGEWDLKPQAILGDSLIYATYSIENIP